MRVREDPERRGLLYAATELGIAVSFDDGEHWQSLQLNLPVVSVRDLVVHGDDLMIATHGRGFWILDDAAPLRQIDAQAAASEALLYKPAKAIRMHPEAFMGTPISPEEPKAMNPPEGAMLDYFLKSAPQGEVILEIRDGKDQLVRRYSTNDRPTPWRPPGAVAEGWLAPPPRFTANAGMNRFAWDLRYAISGTEAAEPDDFGRLTPGPQVIPGVYQVRLTLGGRTYTQPLEVALDPRSQATADDLSKQLELSQQISKAIGEAADAMNQARALRQRKTGQPQTGEVAQLEADLKTLVQELTTALAVAESADRIPPAFSYRVFEQDSRKLAAELAEWKTLRGEAIGHSLID